MILLIKRFYQRMMFNLNFKPYSFESAVLRNEQPLEYKRVLKELRLNGKSEFFIDNKIIKLTK